MINFYKRIIFFTMDDEESRTKGASFGGVSEVVDQILEVKEEDSLAELILLRNLLRLKIKLV